MPFPPPPRRRLSGRHSRSGSFSSDTDDGSQSSLSSPQQQQQNGSGGRKKLDPPILVYHESARSIVFRDHLRRAVRKSSGTTTAADGGDANGDNNKNTILTDNHESLSTMTNDGGGGSGGIPQEDFLAPLPHKPLVAVARRHLSTSNVDHEEAILETPAVQHSGQQQQQQQHHRFHKELDQLETLNTIASEVLDFSHTVAPSEAGIPSNQIGGFQPRVVPLPPLAFGPDDVFTPLAEAEETSHDWSPVDAEVVKLFQTQHCVVKTIKNSDWGAFLHRFCHPELPTGKKKAKYPSAHYDIPPGEDHPFNSFVTSTTLLPKGGKKMRCYGSTSQYTVGVVFALPPDEAYSAQGETEDETATRTKTWSWPAGYSAKTEFNIDGRGRLINGREEALVPLSVLRQYNNDYLTKDSYMIGTRFVKNAGLSQIPYNEVYLRVGGVGRLDNTTTEGGEGAAGTSKRQSRSLDRGVGLPVALFVRSATYGNLISMLRTRARMAQGLGEHHIKGIPLLLLTPESGVRVLTDSLQKELWKIAADNLNPFQNPSIAHKTTISNTKEESFQQKVEELIDLDETMEEMLTPEELARIAGGFGATDDSVANILRHAMDYDRRVNEQRKSKGGHHRQNSHMLQDVVNEGLASALRSGDYHTSRQLLILYSLVASSGPHNYDGEDASSDEDGKEEGKTESRKLLLKKHSSLARDTEIMKKDLELVRKHSNGDSLSTGLPAAPPPPPLDTDRLRSATNSDGLLAVLGAAQVLKAMQDGSAKKRVQEVIDAVEEWVDYGEQSVAFRISSWYDQRAAQGDLKINTNANSNFMAFISNKAIENRKAFAQQLRDAVESTDFNDMSFLTALDRILKRMHAPCLRLELLQYVLGLDNRYSVAHVARSVELAATCLDITLSAAR